MPSKIDRYEFIWKAIQKHGYRYDYRKVVYTRSKDKVCIICREHGEFFQEATSHLQGSNCPHCYNASRKMKQIWDSDEFIEKAKDIFGDEYDYSKVEYDGIFKKVCIICKKHGEFYKSPSKHLRGQGCPKCIRFGVKLTDKEFIERSNSVHNYNYDYSKVDYRNIDTKVCIICKKHGEFYQTPHNHLQGRGCPLCNESKLEKEVAALLDDNSIQYERQKRFKWLGRQSLDFYLPSHQIGIECQGRQHFEPVEVFGGEREYEEVRKRDEKKRILCEMNGINLIYYDFNNKDNVSLIKNILKNDRS